MSEQIDDRGAMDRIIEDPIVELKAALTQREEEIARLNRRIDVDRALRDAGAVDVEVASLLVEQALIGSAERDVGDVVAEIQRRKPFLFAPSLPRLRGAAQSPQPAEAPPRQLERAATDAARSGHRTDLLKYLRLRRKRD